jgi:predicted nucleotidyltransferase
MDELMLAPRQRELVDRVVAALTTVPGIVAIGLGGSHARGRARPDSDLDICLLYSAAAPFDVAEVRAIAARLDQGGNPVVAGLGEWGPWVDGGAWLTIEKQRVDLLYRAEDKVIAVLADAQQGRFESHFDQQPPFGYFGPTLLGEIAIMVPLADPGGRLASLQSRVQTMPLPLRQAIVQQSLWGVEFGLSAFAPKYVAAANVLAVAGCLTRFGQALVLALFALNNRYFLNDKTALDEIAEFALAPADFPQRLTALLAEIGQTREALSRAVTGLRALFDETRQLAGDLYQPLWPLETLTA